MKLQEITVPAGGQATIDFPGIVQTYKHLVVVLTGRGDTAASNVMGFLQFNGDTAANYDRESVFTQGNAGTPINYDQFGTATPETFYLPGASSAANEAGSYIIEIPLYTGTAWNKTYNSQGQVQRAQASGQYGLDLFAGTWRSTAAVTRLTLSLSAGAFAAGTVATLYGVDPQGAFVAPQTASGTMDLVRDYLAVHNGDPIDTVIQNGPWVALVYFAGANTNAWVSATNAHWTVSTGKTLVVVEYLPALKTQYDNAARANRLQNTTDNVTVVDNTFGRAGWPYVGDVTQTVGLATVAAGKTVVLQVQNADTTKRANGVVLLCREV